MLSLYSSEDEFVEVKEPSEILNLAATSFADRVAWSQTRSLQVTLGSSRRRHSVDCCRSKEERPYERVNGRANSPADIGGLAASTTLPADIH